MKQYNNQFTKVSRITGIKVRTIKSWYDKEKAGAPLLVRPFIHAKKGKWTKEEREAICDYYFEHGESITKAIKKFG